MKVRAERAELAAAVAWAAKRITGRAHMPILSGVLVTASSGTLTLRGGEGAGGEGETSLAADVEEAGSVVVPGKLFAAVLAKLQSKPVVLEVDAEQDRLLMTCGRSTYSLRLMPTKDYPQALLAGDDAVRFTLPAAQFTRTVGQVAPAASTDEGRPVLTAVSLEMKDGEVTAAATDSYRLAAKQFDYPDGGGEIAALIPAAILADIASTVSESESTEVEVALEERMAQFTAGGYRISTALTEGSYPNWRGLMPSDDDFVSLLEIDREELLSALGRVSVVASTGANLPLVLEVGDDGEVALTVTSQEAGAANEIVTGKLVEGEGFTSAYNPSFFVQALKATGAERVSLAFRDPLKPALLRPLAPDDETPEQLRIILMPMRVN